MKPYLAIIEGLPLKQVQENEARGQFDFLEQQIDRYQDRIFDLLDSQDLEKRRIHRELRGQLETTLSSVQAYAKAQALQERLSALDETASLKGNMFRDQLDEVREDLKQLSLMKVKTDGSAELSNLSRELNRTTQRIVQCYEEENITTIVPTPSPDSHKVVKSLPRMNLPVFEGDPLEWRSFWELFHSMVERETSLSETEKLFYLRSSIKNKEGQDILTATAGTAGDYEQVVKMLKNRYDCPRPIYRMNLLRIHNKHIAYTKEDFLETLDLHLMGIHCSADRCGRIKHGRRYIQRMVHFHGQRGSSTETRTFSQVLRSKGQSPTAQCQTECPISNNGQEALGCSQESVSIYNFPRQLHNGLLCV